MHQRTRLATIQTQFPIAMNNIVNHANGINAIKQPMFMTESLSGTQNKAKRMLRALHAHPMSPDTSIKK